MTCSSAAAVGGDWPNASGVQQVNYNSWYCVCVCGYEANPIEVEQVAVVLMLW